MDMQNFNLAWLSLTYRCNSRCKWCYAASDDYEKSKDKMLDPNQGKEMINLLSELEVPRVTLIGGEPTVYPHLYQVLEDLQKKEIPAGMVSNGRRLKSREYTRGLFDRGLKYITFSVEGSSPEVHDSTTQVSGSFQEAMEGIGICQEEGINVSTNTNISTLNVRDLENIVDVLKEQGIGKMSFNVCGVCLTDNKTNEYMLNPRQAAQEFERVYQYSRSLGINSRLVTPMPRCNFVELESLKRERSVPGGPCHIVTGRSFVMDYNGDVLPCTHFTGFPFFNVYKNEEIITSEEFISRYNSEEPNTFRKMMSRYPSETCSDCEENCTGGCPIYWTTFNPDEIISGPKKDS